MKRTRLAVVGVGHLGKEHARILASHPDVELVGVVDARAEQAQAVAERSQTRAYSDHQALLDKVDAAVIAVPTAHHHGVACDFLRAGIPLLIEKPLTTTLAEADELLYLSHRHRTFVQVGHIERFNPTFEELLRRPMRPKFISAQRFSVFSGRSLDIGVVLDVMIHDIDMALTLARAPVRDVDAFGATLMGGHEDMAQARLMFANGCVAQLSASRIYTGPVRKMEVWSPEGYASADFHQRRLTLVEPSATLRHLHASAGIPDAALLASLRNDPFAVCFDRHEQECSADGPDQLTRELQEFVASVRTGSPVRVTGEQGREVMAVAAQVLAGIQRHAWEGEVAGPVGPHTLPAPLAPLFSSGDGRSVAAA